MPLFNNKYLTDKISIPAFREEGDRIVPLLLVSFRIFQSPPSVRKATFTAADPDFNPYIFQSPPSVWKATRWHMGAFDDKEFQSPPSVRKATFCLHGCKGGFLAISIPAFREEGDRLW